MYKIIYTNKMKRDMKLMEKRGKNMSKLDSVLQLLRNGEALPQKYRDHQLTGNLCDYRECHIEGNWLLLYQYDRGELILFASGTGTHSDLFG